MGAPWLTPTCACKLAQRQLIDALLAEGALGLREQSRAQVAMVVGALTHVEAA